MKLRIVRLVVDEIRLFLLFALVPFAAPFVLGSSAHVNLTKPRSSNTCKTREEYQGTGLAKTAKLGLRVFVLASYLSRSVNRDQEHTLLYSLW